MKPTIAAGELDRRITIMQRAEQVSDEDGSRVVAWLPLATVWAKVTWLPGGDVEDDDEGVQRVRRPCRIRVRFRRDITSDMRVRLSTSDGGADMRITSVPAETGRREGLEFTAAELSTEGNEP